MWWELSGGGSVRAAVWALVPGSLGHLVSSLVQTPQGCRVVGAGCLVALLSSGDWFPFQMEHLKACAEIAAQRTINWQKFCIKDDCKQCSDFWWLLFIRLSLCELFIEACPVPSAELDARDEALSKAPR